MTTQEKEGIIESWPFPWPDLLHVLKTTRDESLKTAEDEADKQRIVARYEQHVNGFFNTKPK